jgi:putative ABC transport system permease protein
MFKFAIGNAFRRRGIMVLALIGVGLGVALMSTLLSLSEGMDQRLESTLTQVAADITVAPADAPFGGQLLGGGTPLPSTYLEKIEKVQDITWAYPQIVGSIPAQVLGSKLPFGASITGVDATIDKKIGGATQHITKGQTFSKEGEVIVGSEQSRQSRFTGVEFKLGQEIEVPIFNGQLNNQPTSVAIPSSSPQATASAQLQKLSETEKVTLKIVGFFETGNALLDRQLYTDLVTARKLAKLDGSQLSSIRVRATSVDAVDQVSKEIKETLEDEEVEVTVTSAGDLLGNVNDTLDIFRGFLLVIGLVAAVAGGISIFIIMLMSVLERKQEFGILKAAGWSNSNILLSVIIESVTIGFMGAAVGLLVGYGATRAIERYLEEGAAVYSLEIIVGIFGFGILMGILGGLYPAIRAARVAPMETLKAL